MISRLLRRQQGDTIVEVAIAIAIFSVVLAAGYNLANQSFKLGSQAREHTQAIYIAQDQAERLRLIRDEMIKAHPDTTEAGYTDIAQNLANACGTYCYIDTTQPGPGAIVNSSGASCSTPAGIVAAGVLACLKVDPFYYVYIQRMTNPSSVDKVQFQIVVNWQSVVAADINTSKLDVVLVDNRFTPKNCDVVGSC